MRIFIRISVLTLIASTARAQLLTEEQRADLIQKITFLQNAAQRHENSRLSGAIQAYEQAMTTNEAALDLYLKCYEKVRFTDLKKEPKEFRDWKDKNEGIYTDPGFKMALRYQLKWLMLSLQAAQETPDTARLNAEATALLNTIFSDISKVKEHQSVLRESALSSVFAQAYGVATSKAEWPASPIDVAGIYERIILPPLRQPTRLDELNAAWDRRIQLEQLNATEWTQLKITGSRSGSSKDREKQRDKEREMREKERADREVREIKFLAETRPTLLWSKYIDLYNNGQQVGAANRMFEHINAFPHHKSCKSWLNELQQLLQPPDQTSDSAEDEPPAFEIIEPPASTEP